MKDRILNTATTFETDRLILRSNQLNLWHNSLSRRLIRIYLSMKLDTL